MSNCKSEILNLNTAVCENRRIFLCLIKMKTEVLNTINAFTIKVDMEGTTRNQVCLLADLINNIPGYQTTEVIFFYAVKEGFIKVYSDNGTAQELQKEIDKLGF